MSVFELDRCSCWCSTAYAVGISTVMLANTPDVTFPRSWLPFHSETTALLHHHPTPLPPYTHHLHSPQPLPPPPPNTHTHTHTHLRTSPPARLISTASPYPFSWISSTGDPYPLDPPPHPLDDPTPPPDHLPWHPNKTSDHPPPPKMW